jgi:mannose-6-phosphate isomerase-like protein (cupin superfamily)
VPELVHSDAVFRVDPGTTPDYDSDNPLLRLLGLVEQTRLAAEYECYDAASLEHLFPLSWLELYGPSAPNSDQLDATQQDVKTDFQKQNVRDFRLGDTRAVRGWASTGDWRGPFLQLSYRAGPDSALATAGQLGEAIGCVVSVRGGPPVTLRAPYDPASARYLVELWGWNRSPEALRDAVGARGRASLDAALLQSRADVVEGGDGDFDRAAVDEQDIRAVSPRHLMHPVLPLHVDVRWTAAPDGTGAGDPPDGSTRFGFEMRIRGWDAYLGVGTSPNPHGGVGFLEYRNLFSNYGRYAGGNDLARPLEPWNLDALGRKGHASGDVEPFLAVDYMDLHVLDPACGIGLHRHRDNQEVFLMLDGDGIMVIGDWADSGTRARAFEVRRLQPGHLALLKGGNLHALVNPGDQRASLFMFGGYD